MAGSIKQDRAQSRASLRSSLSPATMANPSFLLVNVVTREVTDIDKNPTRFRFADFLPQYDLLRREFKAQGGCEAVILEANDKLSYNRNTPQGAHAEENLFLTANATTLSIKGALIVIEPCYDKRYPGHACQEFFRPAGRKYPRSGSDGVVRKFNALGPNTPIFFLESQPLRGNTSDQSRALARMSKPAAQERLANAGGPQFGIPLRPVAKGGLWKIEGQEFMAAVDILAVLKSNKIDVKTWNSAGCADDVVEDVKNSPTSDGASGGGSASSSSSQSSNPIADTVGHITTQALGSTAVHIAGQAFGMHK